MSQLNKFVIKAVVAAAMTFLGAKYLHQLDHNAIISAAGVLSTVAGILFGFVLASITVLSGFDSGKGLIGALKKNGVLKSIIEGLFSTGATLISACLSALISMFAPDTLWVELDYLLLLLSLSFLIISIVTFFFSWKDFSTIISYL
ncbi:TPA: hypothetical protein ACT24T_004138 [Yersinia enterocolitica]|uniref:hypothetical protein n=1 Tax=Yersinia enterocolitica TaxID=630 RepID=UPI002AADEBF6|nr:hypothetical protein [Yersinia enterocolitica]HDL8288823.1 hypothetical protein [Yersinia enterocolitica]HEM6607808.1 hypothetical protein [Yersinia enterocolitica]HEN3430344.1 hypothetical protein [Yersinia enterocolitica]HEN3520755.1 hypothetical protein [Yersinia enterocolitica]